MKKIGFMEFLTMVREEQIEEENLAKFTGLKLKL
jgi:hypothetical protein